MHVLQPDNRHKEGNPVGRFMVATGAVIVNEKTKKILLTKRSASQDFQPDEWEIIYGRIDQHEDPEQGLRREISEEIGLTDIKIYRVLSVWHIYRGPRSAENELIGITFICSTGTDTVYLSDEHQNYTWVTPEEALSLITVEGIRKDIEKFIQTGKHFQ